MSGQNDTHQPVVEVMNLTASSQMQMQKHQAVLLDLEAKRVATTIDVPTLPHQVRDALRQMGLPVRLFGENLANVRDRLRMELARQKVGVGDVQQELQIQQQQIDQVGAEEEDEEEVTKYTRALPALIEARQEIARFSLARAAARLERERKLRFAAVKRKRSSISKNESDEEQKQDPGILELEQLDQKCLQTFKSIRQISLEGSQYCDSRALSCIAHQKVSNEFPLVATGGWTGTLQLWDGSSPVLSKIGEKTMCHEDRIMGIAMQDLDTQSNSALIATTSIDLTAKLWKVQKSDVVMDENQGENDEQAFSWSITEHAHLKGHAARLCRIAFHPMKKHVVTTSFDHSWRLWDVETNQTAVEGQQELLLQDGHCREVYGVGFHPDGSLCATTDFAGIVQVWDLRTGKSIRHFVGHAKRVLNAEFHPTNGFQLATAGDDGTIRIWDLRRRKQAASIPAHSNLITGLKFDSTNGGEYLASSSFDGTVKLWSTRNWKMLNHLQGHEGKVTGVEILENNTLVSCGFDKTLKMWR